MSMRDFSVGHYKIFTYKGKERKILVEKVTAEFVVGFDIDKGQYRTFRFDRMA
jgi:hypothetical protein